LIVFAVWRFFEQPEREAVAIGLLRVRWPVTHNVIHRTCG